MEKELFGMLRIMIITKEWEDAKEQIRAVFTTLCLAEKIEADTSECDRILGQLYEDGLRQLYEDGARVENYDSFVNYMVELIV